MIRKRIIAVFFSLLMAMSFTCVNAESTYNINHQRYAYNWATPIDSYLYENADGTLTTVQLDEKSSALYHQEYKKDTRIISQGTVSLELPSVGGFYHGSDANYLVVGDSNPNQDDQKEVIRVIKYSFDWKRLGSFSIKGANTYIPFDAGSLRFAENGNCIVFRTAHEMYNSSNDARHHQANMTVVFDKTAMSLIDIADGISNISTGYVSHSFNQFVQFDGNKIVSVDHGDAYPRGIVICRYQEPVNNQGYLKKPDSVMAMTFPGDIGANYTGASVGGFEISDSSYIIAGTYKNETNMTTQNLFISTTDKNNFTSSGTNLRYITNYPSDQHIVVTNPQLVKISSNSFMVMWQEYVEYESGGVKLGVKYLMLDGKGNSVSDINTVSGYLSDCKPAVINGSVTWFYTRNTEPVFCRINVDQSVQSSVKPMYRMYNPNSGEHFYTADPAERDNLIYVGWNYENIGWIAPASSNSPVYRLYNANGGEHHYTLDVNERDSLVRAGWIYEGIGWYSDDQKVTPLYREYNPNQYACNHNYTTSKTEHDYLVSIGWRNEGIGWYGLE